MRLASIHIHPVKSCAPLFVQEAEVRRRGLAHDRRWMIVDADRRFLTGRQLPRLVLLRAVPVADGVLLQAPGREALHVAAPDGSRRLPVTVWKDTVDAAAGHPDADAWLSDFLGRAVRLVYMDARAQRPVSPEYARPDDRVSFADGFPLLLISQASLDGLNARLQRPIPMQRFRPNLVVEGCEAHAEDGWRGVRIGEVEFDMAKLCARCVFTTIDTDSGTPDPDGEPLRTLKGYRRSDKGIRFGVNLIPRGRGVLRVGDAVTADMTAGT